jgi:hypothetical protein
MDYDHLTPYAYDSACLRFDSATGSYMVSSGWVHLYDTVFLDTLTWSTHPDSIIIIDTSYYHHAGPCLQNSFDRNWLFALTAFDDFIYLPASFSPSISVSIPQELFIRSGSTETIEIDWGNGMGWQSLLPGNYTVSYPGFGEKVIRIRRADGRYDDPLTAFARVTLVELPFGAPDFILPFGLGNMPCGISDQGLGIGSGLASVWSATGSTHLRKPFVIVEGFDRDDKKQPLNHPENDRADEWGFGLFTAASFSSGQMGERGEQLALAPYFIDSLLSAGYDVVFVDFMTNGARIEKNGFALIQLIQTINEIMTQNGYNSSIDMMGVSMGGLVLRYALRTMELNDCCHNVRLYGTFATPHRGANIPLGIQHMLYELGHNGLVLEKKGKDAARNYNYVLNCPAARQMTIVHREPSARMEHQAFLHLLDSIGHPEDVIRIGLSNGSATQLGQNSQGTFLQENDVLLDMDIRLFNAPVIVPSVGIVITLVEILDHVINTSNTTGNGPGVYWQFGEAKAYSAIHSPLSASNQKILDRGPAMYQRLWDYGFHLHKVLSLNLALIPFSTNPLTLAVYCASSSALLLANYSRFHFNDYPTHQSHDKWVNFATPAYDHVPGDFVKTQKSISDMSEGQVKSDFPHHAFVNSSSSLDIQTNDLWVHVKDGIEQNQLSTPFDKYWYPGLGENGPSENQRHVEIKPDNIKWIMDILRDAEEEPTQQTRPMPYVLNGYYNYAEPVADNAVPRKFIHSVHIGNQGRLWVNHYGDVGAQGSGVGVVSGGHFVLRSAADCNQPMLEVSQGGELLVGDAASANSGELRISRGSTLAIFNGGVLRVHANSRVVIEPGATLYIAPGALIELSDANAVLEIQGKVHIEDGAIFGFSGPGKMVYNAPADALYSDLWAYGPTSKMQIIGQGQHHTVLEVLSDNFGFKNELETGMPFGSLSIKLGRIELADGIRISHGAALELHHVRITSAGQHKGLWLWGQSQVKIVNCDIDRGEYGIHANLTTFGNNLSIYGSEIWDCNVGIKVRGKGLQLSNCHLHHCGEGLLAEDMEGSSALRNNTVENNYLGITFTGQAGTTLAAESNSVRNNTYGMYLESVGATLRCNTVEMNQMGVLTSLSSMYMNDNARNKLRDNQINLWFESAYELALSEGQNDFGSTGSPGSYQTNYYIHGTFHPNASGLQPVGTGFSLSATENRLPALQNGSVPVWLRKEPNNAVVSLVLNSGYFLAGCNVASPGWEDPFVPTKSLLLANSSSTVVSGSFVAPQGLPQAIVGAINLIAPDSVGGDVLMAINQLDQILSYPIAQPNSEDQEALKTAFDMMLTAYGLALEYGLVQKNRAISAVQPNPYLQKIINYLNASVGGVNPNDPNAYKLIYELELDRAHVYRMTEHYDYALTALSNSEYYASAEDVLRTDYWDCVCTAEEQLLSGEISPDEFQIDLENCRMMLKRGQFPIVPFEMEYSPTEGNAILNMSVQPNPSTNDAVLYFTPQDQGMNLRIVDPQGRTIASRSVDAGNKSFVLENNGLMPGVYYVVLQHDGASETVLWMVL